MSKIDYYQMHKEIHSAEIRELKQAVQNYGGQVYFGHPDDFDEDDEEVQKNISGSFRTGTDRPIITCSTKYNGPQDAYINSIKIDENGSMKVFAEYSEYSDGEFELSTEDIEFGHVSFITDQIPKVKPAEKRTLFIRLGVTITGTKEEIEGVLSGDCGYGRFLIRDLINSGRFYMYGETYVPESSVTEYNEKYGTDFHGEPTYDL